MKRLFDYHSRLMQVLTALTQLLILNLVFCLCSLPLISVGCAFSGLCAGARSIAENNGNFLSSFWQAAKKHPGQSTAIWAAFLVYGGILLLDTLYYYSAAYHFSLSILILLFTGFFVIFAVGLLCFHLLSVTSGTLRERISLSFSLAFSHPLRTLVSCLLYGVFPGCFLLYPPLFLGLIPFWLIFYFSGVTWLVYKLFRPVFSQIRA